MESTLSIVWQELQARVSAFMGWGRGSSYGEAAWSNSQQFDLDGIVASGLRQFYFPPSVEGVAPAGYSWSFLKPVGTITLASGTQTVPLPDDFGSMEGQITIQTTTGLVWSPIDFVGVGQVYAAYTRFPSTTGRPAMACEEPLKGTGPTQGQRFQLRVWPVADAAYTLQFAYYVNPDYLSTPFPYAYGGSQHSETILESCLSVAEERLDDARGVHASKFQERLAASILMDRRSKPQTLGYNRDYSDGLPWTRADQHWDSAIKVHGVQY